MKICTKCKQLKSFDSFNKRSDRKSKLSSSCRDCRKLYNREYDKKYPGKRTLLHKIWSENNRDKTKKYDQKRALKYSCRSRKSCLKYHYNLTLEQYDEMLQKQNNVCAICQKSETVKDKTGKVKHLFVDHCHKTNQIRGLLCHRCNMGIGYLQDNFNLCNKASEYLRKAD